MSRWLANVNSLLEKLDGTVEEAIDEQRNNEEVDNLDSILAKRGLSEMEEMQYDEDKDDNVTFNDQQQAEDLSEEHSSVVVVEGEGEETDGSNLTEEAIVDNGLSEEGTPPHSNEATGEAIVQVTETDEKTQEDVSNESDDPESAEIEEQQDQKVQVQQQNDDVFDLTGTTPVKPVIHSPQLRLSIPVQTPSSTIPDHEYKQAITESRDAQKEARTLRRHVVALNKQLETAEAELEAQRSELQQAGEQLEKDRKKYKEEKEKLTTKHVEEVKALKKMQELLLSDIKSQHQEEMQKIQQQMKIAEEQRMQEGGDMTMELQNTLQREQELVRRIVLME
jgi:hypothetical protein